MNWREQIGWAGAKWDSGAKWGGGTKLNFSSVFGLHCDVQLGRKSSSVDGAILGIEKLLEHNFVSRYPDYPAAPFCPAIPYFVDPPYPFWHFCFCNDGDCWNTVSWKKTFLESIIDWLIERESMYCWEQLFRRSIIHRIWDKNKSWTCQTHFRSLLNWLLEYRLLEEKISWVNYWLPDWTEIDESQRINISSIRHIGSQTIMNHRLVGPASNCVTQLIIGEWTLERKNFLSQLLITWSNGNRWIAENKYFVDSQYIEAGTKIKKSLTCQTHFCLYWLLDRTKINELLRTNISQIRDVEIN